MDRDALKRLLSEARRATRAEAGTVYLREGDQLHFAAVQNDVLAQRVGAAEAEGRLTAGPLGLSTPSPSTYVKITPALVNLPDASQITPERPSEVAPPRGATRAYPARAAVRV